MGFYNEGGEIFKQRWLELFGAWYARERWLSAVYIIPLLDLVIGI
jgi:hypothetical protein